jgi:undecaprenyl-diphosphatase
MEGAHRRRAARFVLTAALVVGVLAPAHAARRPKKHHDDGDTPYWRRNVFRRVFADQKYFVTTWIPAEFNRPGFAAPIVGGALAAAFTSRQGTKENADAYAQLHIWEHAGSSAVDASHAFTSFGNAPELAAILGLTYLGGRYGHNDRLAATASLSFEALVDAGIWAVALKAATARVRPGGPDSSRFLQYGHPRSGSFPSGHAMSAFSVAAVFADQYRSTRWVPYVSYGLATAIGLSRVVVGQHFPTDILVGGVLGASIGHMVSARASDDGDAPRPRWERWTKGIQPLYDPVRGGYGVGWSRNW